MTDEPWSEHTLVFVCGLHRSGTTQLHETLATHPQVSGFHGTDAPHDEGQHLQDVYPTARSHGGPGRFAFDPAAHLTESSPLATPVAAERLFSQWSQHWQLDRPVLIEKSPPNLIRTRYFQQLYPGARFLVIVRHPLVTAFATAKLATTRTMRRTMRRASFVNIFRHWIVAHRLFLTDLPHLEHVRVLRWEDFCAEPVKELHKVGEFVGVDDRFTLPDLDPTVETRYLDLWDDMLSARHWRRRRFAQLLEEVYSYEEDANRFGYSLRDPSARTPFDILELGGRQD